MARMFDSTNPAGIPASSGVPDYALSYVDGKWKTVAAMVKKYPTARQVQISAIPGSATAMSAQGCDGEQGDYSPAQAAQFAKVKLAARVVPFIYCSAATWSAYTNACTATGVPAFLVDWGIAAYPGIGAVLYSGSVFHQWIDYGPYDESVVLDGWVPGRSFIPPDPIPVPAPTPTPEDDMAITNDWLIRQCYREVLHREVDGGGYTTWINFLNGGGDPGEMWAQVQDSAEGQSVLAAERKAIGL